MYGLGWAFLVIGVILLVMAAIIKVLKAADQIDKNSRSPLYCAVIGVVVIVMSFLLVSLVVIEPGSALQIVRFGRFRGAPQLEGIHGMTPFIDKPFVLDCKVRKYTFDIEAGTIEVQPIKVVGVFAWHVNREQLRILLREVGPDYENKAVIPVIQDGVKAACGQHKAESFNRDRRQIMDDAMRIVQNEWHRKYGNMFLAQQASMTDFSFTDDGYKKAIIEKQTAEQHAERESYNLKAAELRAKQEVAMAEGKAKAQSLLRMAVAKDPFVLELKRLEVQSEAVKKWDGRVPVTVFSSGAGQGNFLFGLDALQAQAARSVRGE